MAAGNHPSRLAIKTTSFASHQKPTHAFKGTSEKRGTCHAKQAATSLPHTKTKHISFIFGGNFPHQQYTSTM